MKFIKGIVKGANALVMIAIMAIMFLTVADVVLRWIIKQPILGVSEYSQILMVVILLSTAATGLSDSHIKVDVVMNHCPKVVQKICALLTLIFSLFISVMLSTGIIKEGIRAFATDIRYTTLGIVKYPFYFIYALAMVVLCLGLLYMIINAVRGVIKHE